MPSASQTTPCPTCGYALTGKRCPECGKLLRASLARAEGLRDRRLVLSAIPTVISGCICALLISLPYFAIQIRGTALSLLLLAILASFVFYAIALLMLCNRIVTSLHAAHPEPSTSSIMIEAGGMYIVILLFTGAAAAFFTFAPYLAG